MGYGIGDIGSNIFIVTSGLFLLFFLTNILGIEPALAGLVLLFPKLWDVISDPIMGGISPILVWVEGDHIFSRHQSPSD